MQNMNEVTALPSTTTTADIMAKRPAWAKALIVAIAVEDRSDTLTDYFAGTSTRFVAIGWRKSSREDFRELRKAAANFAPTAHMGPGCDDYAAVIILRDDVVSNGSAYWKDSYSHWHRDMYGENQFNPPHFATEAEAKAFIAAAGDPHPITFQTADGEKTVTFEWIIKRNSIEHRENYSMGGGNYLKAGYRHDTGWKVRSVDILPDGRLAGYPGENSGIEDGLDGEPVAIVAPAAPVETIPAAPDAPAAPVCATCGSTRFDFFLTIVKGSSISHFENGVAVISDGAKWEVVDQIDSEVRCTNGHPLASSDADGAPWNGDINSQFVRVKFFRDCP